MELNLGHQQPPRKLLGSLSGYLANMWVLGRATVTSPPPPSVKAAEPQRDKASQVRTSIWDEPFLAVQTIFQADWNWIPFSYIFDANTRIYFFLLTLLLVIFFKFLIIFKNFGVVKFNSIFLLDWSDISRWFSSLQHIKMLSSIHFWFTWKLFWRNMWRRLPLFLPDWLTSVYHII